MGQLMNADLYAIAEAARVLRAAGVLRLEVDGLKLELAATETMSPISVSLDDALPYSPLPDLSDEVDALNDPATFGRRDGKVPGFQRASEAD
jgi:hypothetical protein